MLLQEEKDDVRQPQLNHRYEGVLKVTGQAKYAYEFEVPNPAYAVMVQSTIPSGSITAIDMSAAKAAPGVLAVITPFNAPALPRPQRWRS